MTSANDILKIRYTSYWFDVDKCIYGRRYVYELFPNGRVLCHEYRDGVKKCFAKYESNIASSEDYREMCEKLNNCITNANQEVEIIDDAGGELVLYRPYGRVDKMPRGYGNENEIVGDIIYQYLRKGKIV